MPYSDVQRAFCEGHNWNVNWLVRKFLDGELRQGWAFDGHVYFVQQEIPREAGKPQKLGPVKIGYTSKSLGGRVAALQTASPFRLKLVAHTGGNREFEAALHRELRLWRMHGEWFDGYAFGLDVLIELFQAWEAAAERAWIEYCREYEPHRLVGAEA